MNDKLKNVVVTIAFVFIIVIFFIANIIKKDDTISIAERRKLEQFPQISAKTVFNGTFFNKFNQFSIYVEGATSHAASSCTDKDFLFLSA